MKTIYEITKKQLAETDIYQVLVENKDEFSCIFILDGKHSINWTPDGRFVVTKHHSVNEERRVPKYVQNAINSAEIEHEEELADYGQMTMIPVFEEELSAMIEADDMKLEEESMYFSRFSQTEYTDLANGFNKDKFWSCYVHTLKTYSNGQKEMCLVHTQWVNFIRADFTIREWKIQDFFNLHEAIQAANTKDDDDYLIAKNDVAASKFLFDMNAKLFLPAVMASGYVQRKGVQ